MASRVTFNTCPDEGLYLGGMLSDDPGMCLTLHIEQKLTGAPYRSIHLGSQASC
jgi:hypothetical protein